MHEDERVKACWIVLTLKTHNYVGGIKEDQCRLQAVDKLTGSSGK